MVIVIAYLWSMADRMGGPFNKPIGILAFVWRLALTTGTGSIFGFLVARQAFDTAFLAPMFVIMSFAYGLAIFMLVLMFSFAAGGAAPGRQAAAAAQEPARGLRRGRALFHPGLSPDQGLWRQELRAWSSWLLFDGGIYSFLFWVGWVLIGGLVPLGIIYHPVLGQDRNWIAAACALVILGGLATLYVIIIGSQAYPLQMFPGQTILESGFFDGVNGAAAAL